MEHKEYVLVYFEEDDEGNSVVAEELHRRIQNLEKRYKSRI